MECGKNMGEKNGMLSVSLWVVRFIPLKFFRRGRLSIGVPFGLCGCAVRTTLLSITRYREGTTWVQDL